MSWEDFLAYPIEDLPFVALVLIISFTVHEFAHAYSAYKFGDNTPKEMGRVTLNPRVHIDLFGAILILIAGFGWARPVLVNPSRFKNPRVMGIIVSAVGPLSNLLLGVLGMLILLTLDSTGLMYAGSNGVNLAIERFFSYFIYLNFLLFIFNLIPLPPLDGYRIVQELVPQPMRIKMDQNVQWGVYIFLLLVFIPPLRRVTLDPILGWWVPLSNFFAKLFQPLF